MHPHAETAGAPASTTRVHPVPVAVPVPVPDAATGPPHHAAHTESAHHPGERSSGGRFESTDVDLVVRAKEGYAGAYDELVRRHEARAYTLAVRLCGDREAAKDITQDAFVRAWRSLATFQQDAAFSTWLHRIVVNTASNAVRTRRARPTQPLLEATSRQLEPPSPVRTEQVVQDRQQEAALYRALAALPYDQRAALVLTGIMDHSYAEAAEILRLPVATVRGRVARGRRTLMTMRKEWS